MSTPSAVRRVVVVGAGSAGCVLAARLSERPDVEVVLLEAGPDRSAHDVPPEVAGPSFVAAKELPGWTWPSLVASRAAGQAPRSYVRGRGVGGSSAVNAMVALTGRPDDYDEWVSRFGCAGWGWDDLGPYFDSTLLDLHRAPDGEWGDVNRALAVAVPSAAAGVLLTRSVDGRRVSAADAYLAPARSRPNLTVIGDALVDRVLLDGGRVRGVVLADGTRVGADVVILAAGAIHSPAVLLRSGVDVPGVGEGLHDHPSFPIALRRRIDADVGSLPIATVATLSSRAAGVDGDCDDVQLLPMEYVDTSQPDLGMVMVALMRSRSRGRVRLASDDPLVDPVVEFDMLADPDDRWRMQRAIDLAEDVLAHRSFDAVGEVLPYDRSDTGVLAALGDYVHAGGTCAMGRVVDTRCRLRDHDGLVVCDASVMPQVPRANTHWPVVAIAERLARLV